MNNSLQLVKVPVLVDASSTAANSGTPKTSEADKCLELAGLIITQYTPLGF